jgi:hypothetical protein
MIAPSFRGSGVGASLQADRIPMALIGVGIAWLLVSKTRLAERVARNERVQAARRRIGEIGIGGSKPEIGSGFSGQIAGPSGELAGDVGDSGRNNGWVHQAAGAARGALGSVRDAGNAVLDRAGSTADLAQRAGGRLAKQVERDPWLIGVAGLVAGALVAALPPPPKAEQKFIEEARGELRGKAREIGREAAECVRKLAETSARRSRHKVEGA